VSRTNGDHSLPSIPLSKSEFQEVRDCAGAMEELSKLMHPPSPYIALRVITDKLQDIIEAVDTRQVNQTVKGRGGLRLALFCLRET
jgi:hypothetical protein